VRSPAPGRSPRWGPGRSCLRHGHGPAGTSFRGLAELQIRLREVSACAA
jgi:hypothetical protein